ncbi:MAG TPA: FkbM family methyltransferase [Methylocella sp.]|nr:FkbM family methyltransferase [Methylocella sp.]
MERTSFQRNLIFDIGMHHALDTRFYLNKGFRVVALEANPAMVSAAMKSLEQEIASQHLVILDRALWSSPDESISFYLNDVKDDWSSVFKSWAEKGNHPSKEIQVTTTTLNRMFDTFGIPYYVKCDIEGADEIFVRQLLADHRRPPFISVEAISLEILALLFAAGYDRIQLVNQAFNPYVTPPSPAREGVEVPVRFNGHMSGLFGLELDPAAWLSFTTAAENYLGFLHLQKRNEKLAHGWLDFHVTSSAFLKTSL